VFDGNCWWQPAVTGGLPQANDGVPEHILKLIVAVDKAENGPVVIETKRNLRTVFAKHRLSAVAPQSVAV
jgi:hypothetical protein